MHPLRRFARVFEGRDLARLPGGVLRVAVAAALGRPQPQAAITLDERDPAFLEDVLDGARWIARHWFRFRALDVHHVPSEGPALLVGNHNGGLVVFDGLFAVLAVWDTFGPQRAVYGLAHDFVSWEPTIRRYVARFGALAAGHAAARAAFDRGHLVLVYPGSEYDSFRPFAERNRIVLAGRTGFIKLALRAGVPIVPIVTAGAQEQFIVLTRGEWLAERLDLPRRIRSHVMPFALSFPWGFTSALLPYLPLPTQVTTAFCAPLRWPDLGPEAADDPATVARCYREVEAVMQKRLDELTRGRVPILGVAHRLR